MTDDKPAINHPEKSLSLARDSADSRSKIKFANGILVLGMHRSGTSAVAGLLARAGAYLGGESELLPAHAHDNPTGYWERHDVVAAHDAVLESNGFKWDQVAGLHSNRLRPDSLAALRDKLRKALTSLVESDRPWLVKDPRLCLFLPQWLQLADNPACIVVVRDPREIAASMREGPRGAYTSHYLIALWEKYLRSALTALRGRPTLFVDYAALLNSPEAQCRRLIRGLTDLGVHGMRLPQTEELLAFVDPHLRRSKPKAHVHMLPSQEALLIWLHEQCSATGPQTIGDVPNDSAVDEILLEFERAFAVQAERTRGEIHARDAEARLTAQRDRDEILRQRDAAAFQLAETRREVETKAIRIRELNARAEEAQRERSISALRLAEITHQRNVAVGELDQTRHERNIAASQRIEAERRARELDNSIRELRASWSWKLTFPLRAIGTLLRPRLPAILEQRLYRAYYALPGISVANKRAFILWLHAHAGWLTHKTLSYRLARQTQSVPAIQSADAVPTRMDQARADEIIANLGHKPMLSVVMPVYNVDRRWLLEAVDSVERQFYPHWQLCIADDASTRQETIDALLEIESRRDERIKITRLEKNAGIAAASNAALALTSGDYVGFLDNDDELTRDALLEVARCIDAIQPDVIYSDEDKLDETGRHVEVHCKPDYSPDYFFSINYLCHFAVIRRSLLVNIGGLREAFDGAQDYDLLLRATECTDKIVHIAKVLYHWRRIPGSTASTSAAKPQTSNAGLRAIVDSMARRGIECSVESGPYPNTFRVRRKIADDPLVSILIPFRDKPELLDTCVSSILDKTRYRHYEILCIDNGSAEPETRAVLDALARRDARVRTLRHDAPFNYSAINNFAAAQAKGEHLLFLNNDTEVISSEWLDAMLEHSQRSEVGVVGARLWYADKTIQHAGVILGPGGVAGHGHLLQPGDDPGYFARIRLVQNLSAVTFACAMTRRDVFENLGGLNERDLRIAFNDIDYCLRAREAGYLIVYTPYALLYHYESKSRGYEDSPEKQLRFAAEIRYMQRRHKAALERGDPYYNPRLSLSNSFQPDLTYAAALPR